MFRKNIFIKNGDVGLKASETYSCPFVSISNNEIIIEYCNCKFCLVLSIDTVSFTFPKNTRNFTMLGLASTNAAE